MITLAYNLSPEIKQNLQSIESFRRQILLTPMSQKVEIRLRWEASIGRVYFTTELSDGILNKKDVINLLHAQSSQKLSPERKIIVNLKKAFDSLSFEWLASSKSVTPKIVINLYDSVFDGKLRKPEHELKQILDYIQAGQEDPVVQAAIVQIEFLRLEPFSQGNGRMARLLAYLFLYKAGYDFRGLLVLEEYWRKDLLKFRSAIEDALKSKNLTFWLEYFSETVAAQLEKTVKNMIAGKYQIEIPAHIWELTSRQKEILDILTEPGRSITNREVQKLFKVSQITASRDLAKLAQLSLIFPKGRGRSVSYTKL